MSTNFYLSKASEEAEREHIGKRSAGWVFLFNGQVNKTYNEWVEALLKRPAEEQIVDEYGRFYTTEQFVEEVQATLKGPAYGEETRPGDIWVDRGFRFANYEFC